MNMAPKWNFKVCANCNSETFVTPLHGDKGGPPFCPICAGEWHAKFTRRRRAGRIVMKAMDLYLKEGGKSRDFEKLALCAGDFGRQFSRLLLGYEPDTIGTDVGDITTELLTDTLQLTHPDKHPPERREMAKRVTQELLALKPYVFPAPKPKPTVTPMPRDENINVRRPNIKEPSQEPAYPCELCADTVPYFYCTACRAEYDKRQRTEREKENAKQREQYKRRQERRRAWEPPTECLWCEGKFKSRRRDAKYCSRACQQAAYRKHKQCPS